MARRALLPLCALLLATPACSSRATGTDDGAPTASPSKPGKGGSMVATISAAAGSNVDDGPYVGVSNGGAKSVGGDYLEMDCRMEVSSDLSESINLRINEGPANTYRWTPAVGTVPLGATSPVILHFTEIHISETGIVLRDWIATGGTLDVTAISNAAISFRIDGATMSSNNRSAVGTFTLDGAGTDLVF